MGAGMIGHPTALGLVRSALHDALLDPKNGPREVWRTPEGVLLALPAGCDRIRLEEVAGPRGVTLACIEPAGVTSVWPFARGKEKDE